MNSLPRRRAKSRSGRTNVSQIAGSPSSQTHAARSSSQAALDSGVFGTGEFISFAIGDDQYGIDITSVREIKGWSEITHLPKQPDYVRGVLNLRGVIVPIIDLRCRFGEGLTETTPLHIVIIAQIDARSVGLLADRVLDIVAIDTSKIQPVPRVAGAARADFLSGLVTVDDGMIALIDLPHLLSAQSEDEALAGSGPASTTS
jgi:purine-binding chemotaxis protein CheW